MHTLKANYFKRRFFKTKAVSNTYRIPETWDELTTKQLLAVIDIATNPYYDEPQKKTMLIQRLTEMDLELFSDLTEIQVISIYDVTKVFLEEPYLIVCPFPELICSKYFGLKVSKLIGPGNGFSDLTFDEFIEAEDYYYDYCEAVRTKGSNYEAVMDKSLRMIIATLWRPAKFRPVFSEGENADRRKAFRAHTVAERYELTQRVGWKKCLAMLWYYQGCRSMLEKLYENAFDHGGGADTTPDRESWLKMIGQLPNEKFGTIGTIGSQNMLSVLYFTDQYIESNRKKAANPQ